jgi:hypothetical protein
MRATKIFYREFWGATKRADLLATLAHEGASFEASYAPLHPLNINRFSLRKTHGASTFFNWINVRELAAVDPISGLQEMRRNRLIDADKGKLEAVIAAYLDPKRSTAQLAAAGIGPTEPGGRFDPDVARARLLHAGSDAVEIRRYAFQPLDTRWCAWTAVRPVWNEPRPELVRHIAAYNSAFITRMIAERPHEQLPALVSCALPDYHLLRPNVVAFPFMLNGPAQAGSDDLLSLSGVQSGRCNLAPSVLAYLSSRAVRDPDINPEAAALVWYHALAVCCAPAYLSDNGEAIRQGWPRIPLPGSADLLATSAQLGAQVAALLDPDVPVPGVTQGTPRPELAGIAVPSTAPGATRDWALTAWGHRTEKGVTMPGRGRTDERAYASGEAAAASQAALLGATTRDVWMNGASFWRNIPDAVWETHIGGYQVIKKWLSYRDHSILGRALTEAEVRHVQDTARRLAALRLMGPDLDASFRACAAAHVPLAG